MPYFTYILECDKGMYYVGSTDNLNRRMTEHRSARPGSFLYRYPMKSLLGTKAFETRREAILEEKRIKKWPKERKRKWAAQVVRDL